MKITWISPDPEPAYANFVCSGCLKRINKDEPIYIAKQGSKTVKLCEDCAEMAEMDREVTQDLREEWLGENW